MSVPKQRQQCTITKPVQIICPHCNKTLKVPMCDAVNGKKIICPHCRREFVFRQPENL